MSNETNFSAAGVAGTDGEVPLYEPDKPFRIWSLAEIFTGGPGLNRYVPKVNDMVVELNAFEWYIVTDLDQTTLIPTLNRRLGALPNQLIDANDQLLGVGPGTISDTYRVYIDKSVMPHTMAVDSRLRMFGTMTKTVKIFRGSDLTGNAKVISAMYSPSGTLLGPDIPLELVQMPNGINKAVKSIPTCYTSEDLPDGEILTIVAYADDGHVVMKCQVLVENTAFITAADSSLKFITGISLESPFMSSADPDLLLFPMNVPLNGLSLIGVVHYNDGSMLRQPVDQTKFSLYGFNSFVSTIVGQTLDLSLSYRLSDNEVVYGASVGENRTVNKAYTARTQNKLGMYTPKLYAYPVWIDEVNGYRLEWWMYDLDRNLSTLVTPHVKINTNSPVFDPTGYGRKQSLSVTINLKDVHPSGLGYLHVQTIDIVLRQKGSSRESNWAIGFDPNQEVLFGEGNFASTVFTNVNLSTINIRCGETILANWLQRLYYMTKPLTDQEKESGPPLPNFFSIATESWEVAYPLTQWNQTLTLNHNLPNSGTVFVKFFQRTADTDIQLSIAAMPIYQQN